MHCKERQRISISETEKFQMLCFQDEMAKEAILVEDHYKDASFREQYFRPANKPRGNRANDFSMKNN